MKHVTIKTIAKEMNLSVSAISKSLNNYSDINESTKEAVVAKALELGYSPNMIARNLVKSASNSIGVVVRDSSTIYGEILKPLSQAALNRNLTIVMGDSNRSKERQLSHIKAMIESRVMGLVIAPVDTDIEDIEKAVANRFPIVYLGGHVTDPKKNYVAVDCDNGVIQAVNYLYSLGHRNIALVADAKATASTRTKLLAFKREMKIRGLEPDTFIDRIDDGDLIRAGKDQVERILSSSKQFTAIFAVKDMLAAGIMQALKDRNLSVPEDISVLGYDGAEVSSFPMINLTTIAQPKAEIAKHILDIILSHQDSNRSQEPKHYLVSPKLIERSSCKRIEGSFK
ncbi:MAG: LacI family transcriptional regulator [Sphaerochaetaceae bacterium]|nr:LacI family transcriptional regulator [Sphaerochaetaceae bacterium]